MLLSPVTIIVAAIIFVVLAVVTSVLYSENKMSAYRISAIVSLLLLLFVGFLAWEQHIIWLVWVGGILFGILVFLTFLCWKDSVPSIDGDEDGIVPYDD